MPAVKHDSCVNVCSAFFRHTRARVQGTHTKKQGKEMVPSQTRDSDRGITADVILGCKARAGTAVLGQATENSTLLLPFLAEPKAGGGIRPWDSAR